MSSENKTSNSSAEKQLKQSRREEVNQALRDACNFVTQQLSEMIDQESVSKVSSVSSKTGGRLPKELNFKLFDIERKLLMYLKVLRKEDGKVIFDQSVLPFHTERRVKGPPGFSWKTIFNREFVSKKKVKGISGEETTVDVRSNSRFQSAGVTTFLAVDVKRLLNPKGIKVIDVSDSSKSNKTVYQITVFPLEENYKSTHGSSSYGSSSYGSSSYGSSSTPSKNEFVNDMITTAPPAPVKEGKWVKIVKGTHETVEKDLEEVKQNLDAKLEAVSAAVAAETETVVDATPPVEEQISAE